MDIVSKDLKAEEAIKLLEAGHSVKECAGQLGYKARAHFSHDFKEYFGRPPSQRAVEFLLAPLSEEMSGFGTKCRVLAPLNASSEGRVGV